MHIAFCFVLFCFIGGVVLKIRYYKSLHKSLLLEEKGVFFYYLFIYFFFFFIIFFYFLFLFWVKGQSKNVKIIWIRPNVTLNCVAAKYDNKTRFCKTLDWMDYFQHMSLLALKAGQTPNGR